MHGFDWWCADLDQRGVCDVRDPIRARDPIISWLTCRREERPLACALPLSPCALPRILKV